MLDAWLFGNASEVKSDVIQKQLEPILIDGENVERAFKLIRDMFVFTNKRLILVDKQGMTGNKIEYHSVPYKSVIHFSIETAGNFDRDSELKLYITGGQMIEKELKRTIDIRSLQKTLATYILR
mgnify:CR=1 FL=1